VVPRLRLGQPSHEIRVELEALEVYECRAIQLGDDLAELILGDVLRLDEQAANFLARLQVLLEYVLELLVVDQPQLEQQFAKADLLGPFGTNHRAFEFVDGTFVHLAGPSQRRGGRSLSTPRSLRIGTTAGSL
jgi:hypothetical protein